MCFILALTKVQLKKHTKNIGSLIGCSWKLAFYNVLTKQGTHSIAHTKPLIFVEEYRLSFFGVEKKQKSILDFFINFFK